MIISDKYCSLFRLLFVILFSLLVLSCDQSMKNGKLSEKDSVAQDDIAQIHKEGVLKVVVDYNSTNYFIYRGKPMGYQYDLIQAYAKIWR